MAGKRSYGDPCGIARSLDLIGERWALLVVRELLLGPKRFTDLRAGLPGLGPDVLTQRLKDLEANGIVARRTLPAPAASKVYELTPWGAQLEPVIIELGRWGSKAPFPREHGTLSPDSFVLALKTVFESGPDAHVALMIGDQAFDTRVQDGAFSVTRGASGAPARIDNDTATLAQVLWHGAPVERLSIDGDRDEATRWLESFRSSLSVSLA